MTENDFPRELLDIARDATLLFEESYDAGQALISRLEIGQEYSYHITLPRHASLEAQVQGLLHELMHFHPSFLSYSLTPSLPMPGAQKIMLPCGFQVFSELQDTRDDEIENQIEARAQNIYHTRPDVVAQLSDIISSFPKRYAARFAELPF